MESTSPRVSRPAPEDAERHPVNAEVQNGPAPNLLLPGDYVPEQRTERHEAEECNNKEGGKEGAFQISSCVVKVLISIHNVQIQSEDSNNTSVASAEGLW